VEKPDLRRLQRQVSWLHGSINTRDGRKGKDEVDDGSSVRAERLE